MTIVFDLVPLHDGKPSGSPVGSVTLIVEPTERGTYRIIGQRRRRTADYRGRVCMVEVAR